MIETRDLVKTFDGVPALDGLSLTIPDGEFVVLAGPNGSGKTTLVRHFNGLLEADAGEVLVDGTPVQDDLVAARVAVGMVFQHPRDQFVAATIGGGSRLRSAEPWPPTPRDNRPRGGRARRRRPGGRDEERVAALSGGEQERLAIAGALAMRPAHLVLDEPFTGLDAPAQAAVRDRLAALKAAGTSVVVVTHDLRDVADLADRVVVLRDGTIAADGDYDAVHERLPDLGVRQP